MELQEVKGIGKELIKKLNTLGIYSFYDLIEYYPYRYNYIQVVDISNTLENEVNTVKATIIDTPKVSYIRRNFNRLSFRAISSGQVINVTIFNRAFLKPHLSINKDVFLIGKYNKLKNSFSANDIKFNLEDNKIEAVYHLCEGLKNSTLTKIIDEALNNDDYRDELPDFYMKKYNFINKKEALNEIHHPSNFYLLKNAIKREKYTELFNFMFKINYLKSLNNKAEGIKREISENCISDFTNSLPFTLTQNQIEAIQDIYNDLNNNSRMNRLVLGDVGSGKTIVATFAIYQNYLSGYQSALMAPTEILAEQHYKNLKETLSKFNINVKLLTGNMKKKEKEEIVTNLKNGTIDVLIGTHALISGNVEFNKLGLVITDEQHRFGVRERNLLSEKGITPDALYLSATPIPRTYALTIYGDLDISMIKTKPQGRREIITKVKKESEMKDVLYAILSELKAGHQIYIVSPLIENNGETNLKSVFDLEEKLNLAFQNKVKIGILHGKLKADEKDAIMEEYKNGKIKILISTTVIEVGIDVKNSTMIVIYNAERFGLATLHQLRGRVGRNELQSYCYLISNYDIERLKVLEESNDGFYISEKDFEMRGQGDLFGSKQSGEMPFKIANLKKDYDLLIQAKKDSEEFILSNDYLNYDYYRNIIKEINFMG